METLQIHTGGGVATLQLDRGKANPMNRKMIEELASALHTFSEDPGTKGVIITGKPGVFSAGLDVVALSQSDRDEMEAFWRAFMDLVYGAMTFPKPLIAAVSGHSPAGGCVLALCCDYRIMAEGPFKIGLNEVPVGIAVPGFIFELYAFAIGNAKAYSYLMEGKLLGLEEALAVGLLHETAAPEELMEKAMKKMRQYLMYDQGTWQKTKLNLKRSLTKKMRKNMIGALPGMLDHWFQPESQRVLHALVASLKK